MTEIWRLTACDIAQKVRAREISARETAEAALERLDAVNPHLNAVVDHDPKRFLKRADEIDQAIAKGDDAGLLAGVPVTVKINIDQAGFATTNGVTLQRDLIAQCNSPIVDNLERAGANILGRTNAPAFSFRWFTSNRLYGSTKNPCNPELTPGGSSGGAAAATAAGICALAQGTDVAGSIRYPAYACGIHGLRPTPGRVPAFNASSPERPIGPQLMAVSGPIARTVSDLRLALAAMSAEDDRDPWWSPTPLDVPVKNKRAALCVCPGGLATCREVEAALRNAARHLEASGWQVEEMEDVPYIEEAAELNVQLWLAEGFANTVALAERENDPGALAVIRYFQPRARSWSADTVLNALTRRATLVRIWRQFFHKYSVLLLPVSAELPFADGIDTRSPADFDRVFRAQLTQLAIPPLGLPALSLSTQMIGSTPVGVQLVAGPFHEDLCLIAGAIIESHRAPHTPIDPVIH
jgi:amidase